MKKTFVVTAPSRNPRGDRMFTVLAETEQEAIENVRSRGLEIEVSDRIDSANGGVDWNDATARVKSHCPR